MLSTLDKIVLLCLLVSCALANNSLAQNDRAHWEVFEGLDIDHNTAMPTVTKFPFIVPSGHYFLGASYADINGNQLFTYRNDSIFDRNGNLMQGYSSLYPNHFPNYHHIIKSIPFKHPKGNGTYGILAMSETQKNQNVSYALHIIEIDSSLNNGNGAVTNISLVKKLPVGHSYCLALVQHCNQNDYWALTHQGSNSNSFEAYLINKNGLQPAPVVSNVGPSITRTGGSLTNGSRQFSYGYNLKASPDGQKAAIAIRFSDNLQNASIGFYLFDFNNSNGSLTNSLNLTPGTSFGISSNQQLRDTCITFPMDVCFSQNSQKLYGTIVGRKIGSRLTINKDTLWGLHQWDLSSGNAATIQNSFQQIYKVDTLKQFYGAHYREGLQGGIERLQRAPNGKIYFNRTTTVHTQIYGTHSKFSEYIGVIHSPNLLGQMANVQTNYLYIGKLQNVRTNVAIAFPLFPNSANGFSSFTVSSRCLDDTATFNVSNPRCLLSAKWNFDDAASGVFNTDTGFTAKHKFSAAGTYDVQLIAQYSSHTDTFYRKIEIEAPPAPYLGSDTILCVGDSILVSDSALTQPRVTRWYNGKFGISQWIKQSGSYWVSQTNQCGIRYDTIHISSLTKPQLQLRPDTNLCVPDSITIGAHSNRSSYLWNTGSKDSVLNVSQSGDYILTATNACGTDQDTVVLKVYSPLPTDALGVDTAICTGTIYQINLKTSAYKYTWHNGWNSASNLVNQPGIYWVELINACGTYSDTLKVDSLIPPVVDLGSDTVICKNGILILDASQPMASYQWNPASSAPQYRATSAGSYAVTVTNPCGSEQDSIIISPLKKPGIDLGLDTAICPGDSLLLSVSADLATYFWHNHSVDSSILANTAGQYWVKASNQCGSDSAGINIRELSPAKISLSTTDTLLCNDEYWTVDVTQDKGSYVWSSGHTKPVQTLRKEGTYRVTVSNACAIDSTEINVQHYYNPLASLPADTAICNSSQIILSTNETRDDLLWSSGSDSGLLVIQESGTYWLQLKNPCGTSTDSIEVIYSKPPRLTSSTFYHFCPGDQLTLSLTSDDSTSQFYWEDIDSYGATQLLLNEGKYNILLSNVHGCASRQKIELSSASCHQTIYIPNSFTPNIDNNNERWKVYSEKPLNEFNVLIYNRWGQAVYQSNDQSEGWDGFYSDNNMSTNDVYTYIVTYRDNQAQARKKTGSITLIR